MNFPGGSLGLTTTSGSGFSATGGGTVSVTGANNTISSTTGTALNVVSTTIGGSGLTFKSINSNGAASGIILSTTGAGSLTVTGDGASDSAHATRRNTTATAGRGALHVVAGNCCSTCNWQNSFFLSSRENLVGLTQGVTNTSVNVNITITNSEFRDTTTFASPANDAFLVAAFNNAVTSITATGSTFKNVEVAGFKDHGNHNSIRNPNGRNGL